MDKGSVVQRLRRLAMESDGFGWAPVRCGRAVILGSSLTAVRLSFLVCNVAMIVGPTLWFCCQD